VLKLGVIGLSKGNGHPYSWSAICNGYNHSQMLRCGFDVIPQYLSERQWPAAKLSNVQVTHIWTQSRDISENVSLASLIPNIVDDPSEMLNSIDGMLLARDDSENHLEYARPFIEHGLPIYIDKPIALNIETLNKLYSLQKYEGQIFTCSALRYARELSLEAIDLSKVGTIKSVTAETPKSWRKYAVHVIEPVIQLLGPRHKNLKFISCVKGSDNGAMVILKDHEDLVVNLIAKGERVSTPISITVVGDSGSQVLTFSNPFDAFKSALGEFIDGISTNKCKSPYDFNKRVVSIIEMGMH
jgi:predicted dehydrogenase